MTRVAVDGGATPQVVAAIVAALRAFARDEVAPTTPTARPPAWRRAARREASRATRP